MLLLCILASLPTSYSVFQNKCLIISAELTIFSLLVFFFFSSFFYFFQLLICSRTFPKKKDTLIFPHKKKKKISPHLLFERCFFLSITSLSFSSSSSTRSLRFSSYHVPLWHSHPLVPSSPSLLPPPSLSFFSPSFSSSSPLVPLSSSPPSGIRRRKGSQNFIRKTS